MSAVPPARKLAETEEIKTVKTPTMSFFEALFFFFLGPTEFVFNDISIILLLKEMHEKFRQNKLRGEGRGGGGGGNIFFLVVFI